MNTIEAQIVGVALHHVSVEIGSCFFFYKLVFVDLKSGLGCINFIGSLYSQQYLQGVPGCNLFTVIHQQPVSDKKN